MPSDRQKLILKAIIEDYVITQEPVGSKTLTEKPYLDFSSATIRYDMQHLEEAGYLEKTHTSSGRAPSEKGYRFYVDNLLTRDENVKDIYDGINHIVSNKYLTKEEIMQSLLNYVSDKTGYYLSLLGSSACYARVKKMEIVPLNDKDCLLLIVTNSGVVRSQRISVPKDFKLEDLLKIMQMFDVAMYDQAIYEIRDVLSKEAMKPRIRQMVDFRDDILNFMIKGFASFLNNECYQSGLAKLFRQPEFQNYQVMQKIVKAIDENKLNNYMLERGHSLKVYIGSANQEIGLEDCTIITVPYFLDEDEYGTILLVGPKRLNYKKTIPVMEYLANSLSKIYK